MLDIPLGLLEPWVWSAIRWVTTKAASTNGNKKCNEKNLFNVALFTENPPQINSTRSLPNTGIADKRFVITVA